jgi:hypothetical protein
MAWSLCTGKDKSETRSRNTSAWRHLFQLPAPSLRASLRRLLVLRISVCHSTSIQTNNAHKCHRLMMHAESWHLAARADRLSVLCKQGWKSGFDVVVLWMRRCGRSGIAAKPPAQACQGGIDLPSPPCADQQGPRSTDVGSPRDPPINNDATQVTVSFACFTGFHSTKYPQHSLRYPTPHTTPHTCSWQAPKPSLAEGAEQWD